MDNQGIFNGNATGSLVNYNAPAAQAIGVGAYNNLFINNGGLNSLGGNITIGSMLSIVSGEIVTSNHLLTLALTASIIGAEPDKFIVTNGGLGSGVGKTNIGQGGSRSDFVSIGLIVQKDK